MRRFATRFVTLWRLGKAFIRASRVPHGGAPLLRVSRSVAAFGKGPAALSARAPLLGNLAQVMARASGVLERHPALSEAAVRTVLAEFGGLSEALGPAGFRAALEAALPPGKCDALEDLSAVPLRRGIAEQTHTARLGATPLRVTLVRADTRAELADDLDLVLGAARFAERWSREARTLHFPALIEQVSVSVHGMLDLRQRAADQSLLRYRLRADERLVVPEVFWDFCNDAVLSTRHIRSVPLDACRALGEHGLDPARLVTTWIEVFFEMALGQGVYHAGLDAAGAAVSIEPDTLGKLVLEADTPMMLFAVHERDFLVTAAGALLGGDHKAAARAHLELGQRSALGAHHEVRVEAAYRRHAERFVAADAALQRGAGCAPGRSPGMTDLFAALGNGSLEHASSDAHVSIASRAALLSRAAHSIEALVCKIAPEVDMWRIARQVIVRLALDQLGRHGFVAQLAQEAARWPHTLPRMPRLLADWLAREQHAQRRPGTGTISK